MTKVKICGITNGDDAIACIDAGADMLGFNFYSGSSRFISAEVAAAIIAQIDKSTGAIGVFVNETVDRLMQIVEATGIVAVQLHGDESREYIASVKDCCGVAVIKALRVQNGPFEIDPQGCGADAILLDTHVGAAFGGTGQTFDWSVAAVLRDTLPRLYLAGGLTPDNVASAIRRVRPFAVDVASGVEVSPGKKDREKVAAFIKAAKEAL